MAIEFKLPEVSEGVTTAEVAELLVAEGDVVTAGQVVAEVETEKAAAPVECPHAGTVTKVHVAAGDEVEIGAVLLTIDAEVAAGAGSGGGSTPSGDPAAETDAAPAPPVPTPVAPAATNGEAATKDDRPPAPAAPSVRRLARELGVDLHAVPGSARGGRILAEDVKAFAEGGSAAPAGVPAPFDRGGISPAVAATATGDLPAMKAPDLPDFGDFGAISRQKMNKLARTAANNLSYAWQTIPHVTQHDHADITELEAARKQYTQTVGKNGPKVTMTAIMVKACVAALKQHPFFNSSLDLGSGEIIVKEYFHIGIAVDTEAGLVVPVIRDADQKSILEIAADVTDIAVKARDRKLSMADMQGGTFTITNLGGLGGSSFTPIVNYPEVAILGMSRTQPTLKLIDGKPVERKMLPLSLSYDHRVINGADAARFITTLSGSLGDFMSLLVRA